jgi:hypothetical protein
MSFSSFICEVRQFFANFSGLVDALRMYITASFLLPHIHNFQSYPMILEYLQLYYLIYRLIHSFSTVKDDIFLQNKEQIN